MGAVLGCNAKVWKGKEETSFRDDCKKALKASYTIEDKAEKDEEGASGIKWKLVKQNTR